MNKPTYEQLEAQVKQLAAENAALKSGLQAAFDEMEAHHDDEGLYSYDADGEQMDALLRVCDAQGTISNLAEIKTPATDSAIAALRAEGVEMFAEYTSRDKCRDRESEMEMGEVFDSAFDFAAKLRQSVQVKGVKS